MQKTSYFIAEKLRNLIFSQALAEEFKMKEQDFTRNRKQPFVATLLFMLNSLRKSFAIEIDGFVRHLKGHLAFGDSDPLYLKCFYLEQAKRSIRQYLAVYRK